MPVNLLCPQCQKLLAIPDTLLDKPVLCPGCKKVFNAARPTAPTVPPPAPPATAPTPSETPALEAARPTPPPAPTQALLNMPLLELEKVSDAPTPFLELEKVSDAPSEEEIPVLEPITTKPPNAAPAHIPVIMPLEDDIPTIEPTRPVDIPVLKLAEPVVPRSRSYAGPHAAPEEADRQLGVEALLPINGVTVALVGLVLLQLLGVLLTIWSIWQRQLAGNGFEPPSHWDPLVGLLLLGVVFLTAVVLLVWSYMAGANVQRLGAQGTTWSAGMAVGGWLIPLFNLLAPLLVLQEIWKASHPNVVKYAAQSWKQARASLLIVVWWVAYLLSFVMACVVVVMLIIVLGQQPQRARADGPPLPPQRGLTIADVHAWELATRGLYSVQILLFGIVAMRIALRQTQRWEALHNEREDDT